MRRTMVFGLSILGVLSAVAGAAWSAPPIEIFGREPDFQDVQISADGNKLAMARFADGKSILVILDRVTGKAASYNMGDIKTRGIAWSGDDHVLIFVSETTNFVEFRSSMVEFCGVYSLNIKTNSKPKQLLAASKSLSLQASLCGVADSLWTEKGEVLMAASMESGSAFMGGARLSEGALYRVDGDTGHGSIIAKGDKDTWYWVASPKGHVIARVDHIDESNRYRVMVPTDEDRLGGWKAVYKEEVAIPEMSVYGANAAEDALIVGTRSKSDRFALFEMSLADGNIGKTVYEADGVDISGVIRDRYTGAVVGASYILDRSEQVFFQNDLQAVLGAAKGALKDQETVRLISWDRARRTFVIFASGTASAGDYFLLDKTKGKLEHIASWREGITKNDLAPQRAFTYKARDGLTIPAILTLPPGTPADSKNLPLVVFPHGGPASRDTLGFNYWVQAMATRGYAVLQMNFRGSDGYGRQFEEAGWGEWGGKMQDDVTDGVQEMIKTGLADSKRVCIVGGGSGGYGGYAALAGAAFTPELYKCAVSVAGVADLPLMTAWRRNRSGEKSSYFEYWQRSTGGDQARNAQRSPVNAAANVMADVLLIHGNNDTVVPFKQSEFMRDALKDAGKPAQLIKLDGEDHWLSTPKTRTEMLKALEAFLAKHLG
jgi:dipeptidyl aminopeptidase/acylaminoacyl peptidase